MNISTKIGMVMLLAAAWTLLGQGHALALDLSDVVTASTGQGCKLIPYDTKQQLCVTENVGLHDPGACGARACQQTPTGTSNAARKAAWQNCVAKRTKINGYFSSTVKKLKNLQTGPQYGGRRQKYKMAVRTIIENIELGQRPHNTQLSTAKRELANCNNFVN